MKELLLKELFFEALFVPKQRLPVRLGVRDVICGVLGASVVGGVGTTPAFLIVSFAVVSSLDMTSKMARYPAWILPKKSGIFVKILRYTSAKTGGCRTE